MAGNNLFSPQNNLFGSPAPQPAAQPSKPSAAQSIVGGLTTIAQGFASAEAKQAHNDALGASEAAKANSKPFVNMNRGNV